MKLFDQPGYKYVVPQGSGTGLGNCTEGGARGPLMRKRAKVKKK